MQKELDIQKVVNEDLITNKSYNRDDYPRCFNVSTAMFYDQIPTPKSRKSPEFVFLKNHYNGQRDIEKELTIADWNNVWEVGQLRTSFFWDRLPKTLDWLRSYDTENIYLVPEDDIYPYATYCPLIHLLPFRTRKKFGIPQLKAGKWPYGLSTGFHIYKNLFKGSFKENLSKAFANHIWPILNKQSKISSFSKDDPIVILSHNLKFWLPHLYSTIEDELRNFGRVKIKSEGQKQKIQLLQEQYPEIDVKVPLLGGDIWRGEHEAWDITRKVIEKADENGQLTNLFDAIKSNRIKDDFSDKWSYAKEDFERRLYKKRNKYKINFVEIESAIPIHSNTSEILENEIWDDFLSILNHKERNILICLRKGITKHKEISEILGYKNHSPVTKSISKIRRIAETEMGIKPNKKYR